MKEKQDGILKKNVTRCGGWAQHVAGGKGAMSRATAQGLGPFATQNRAVLAQE